MTREQSWAVKTLAAVNPVMGVYQHKLEGRGEMKQGRPEEKLPGSQ